jgi:hypothetical protein
MNLKITRERALWSQSQINEKELVIVEFPNCISTTTGKPFKWLPSYSQLAEIKEELDKAEIELWLKD